MDKIKKDNRKNWFYSYNMIFKMDISAHSKLVYLYLCRCADSESQCFPSKTTISENCSISVTSVKNAIKELISVGLLKKNQQYRENGSQTSNLYCVFEEPELDAEVLTEELANEIVVNQENEKELEELIPEPVTNPKDEKKKDNQNIPGAKYASPRSKCAPHPGQNTPTGGTHFDHLEGLPIIRTTHNEVQSVRQLDMLEKDNDLYGLERIKEKCEFHLFEDVKLKNMIENAIEIMWFSEYLQIGSAKIPQAMVRSRMYGLHGAIIFYALEKIQAKTVNTERVTNSTKYLVSTIYNSINEYHSDAVVEPELNRMKILAFN